jgi:hypothetical protein
MPKIQKIFIWLLVVVLLVMIYQSFLGSTTFVEGLTPTPTPRPTASPSPSPSPSITGTDPGVLARIAENAGNIKVLESRLNALSGIDSRVTTNTTNIKDLQDKITALSVSQTQMLTSQFAD